MRKLILTFVTASALLSACTNDKKADTVTDTVVAIPADTLAAPATEPYADGCYAYMKNRDTASLALKIAGEEITGDLSYSLYEKDSNKGTIAGEIKGDTIIAEYDFNSEGVRSIREIVFLKKGDKLYEGYGEVETKGMKTMFKNRAQLNFKDGIIFDPTTCK
jgi:hypothetical protein